MEASTLHAPRFRRVSLPPALLRLRSDEQLLALFRAGSDEAFGTLHERYRQRLFAYVRQMLSSGSRQDAEDVLQDVFVRAFRALRADEREVNVKAWLYRVAHNRCIDHLRRPEPPAAELIELHSRKPLHDPLEEAQRREHLKQLVRDVGNLPPQQRSALLMREMDGLSYVDLAGALDVTVPAVKSLLVRARVGLVEAAEARDTDCDAIQRDLVSASDRGVKASALARRHMRECASCREYRVALRGVRRSFAALAPPAAFGPLALLAPLLGGGGAATGGSAVAGGGASTTVALVGGGGVATTTAGKVAAVVCASAALTGGAAEVKRLVVPAPPAAVAAARPAAPAAAPAALVAPAPDRAAAAFAPAAAPEREPGELLAVAVAAPGETETEARARAEAETNPALLLDPVPGEGEDAAGPAGPAPDVLDEGAPVLVLPADDAPGGVAAPAEEPALGAPASEDAGSDTGGPAPEPERAPAAPESAAAPPATAAPEPASAAGTPPVDPALAGGVAAP